MPTTESSLGVTFVPGADLTSLQTASVDFVLALMDPKMEDKQVKWIGVTAVFQAYEALGANDADPLKVAIARLQKIMAPSAPAAK